MLPDNYAGKVPCGIKNDYAENVPCGITLVRLLVEFQPPSPKVLQKSLIL